MKTNTPLNQAVLTLLGATALLSLSACSGSGDPATPTDSDKSQPLSIAADPASFEKYLKQELTESLFQPRSAVDDAEPTPQTDGAAESADNSFTGTNLIEAGVDEADWLKFDGEFFYVLEQAEQHYCCFIGFTTPGIAVSEIAPVTLPQTGRLNIYQLNTDQQSIDLHSSLELNTEEHQAWGNERLFISQNQVIRIASSSPYYNYWGTSSETLLTRIDTSAPDQPQITHRAKVSGHPISQRQIGDTIIIVSEHMPALPYVAESTENERRQRIADADLADFMPRFSDAAGEQTLNANGCYFNADLDASQYGYPAITTITLLNSSDLSVKDSQCIYGTAGNTYVSPNGIYLSSTLYGDGSRDNQTRIDHFSLTNTGLGYQGLGTVSGHFNWSADPSFFMSERDGYLRIVTSTHDSEHRLHVLKLNSDSLSHVATLPEAGSQQRIGKPDEDIRAVRFIDDKAYIVTFQKTDPLYTLDLSNPEQPRIAGELEIDGYSGYLHGLGDDLLLGVGKDAIPAAEGDFAWFQGVKLSLFDVSEDTPREIRSISIGDRGSEAPVERNHHSIAVLKQGDEYRIALPLQYHSGSTTQPWESAPWQESRIDLLDVINSELTARSSITLESNTSGQAFSYPQGSISNARAIIHGDKVYSFYNSEPVGITSW